MSVDTMAPNLKKPTFPEIQLRADPPKILVLYGSLRERAYSRLLAEEAGRILEGLGCDVRFLSGDARDHHRRIQESNRLDSAFHWRREAYAGKNTGGDAGQWWFAVVQCGQHITSARALDANADDSQPVLGAEGLSGIS